MLSPLSLVVGDLEFASDLCASPVGPFFDHFTMHIQRLFQLFRTRHLANTKVIPGRNARTVHIRLIRVRITFQGRINRPFHNVQRGIEARRDIVADWLIKVIAEEEIGAADVVLGYEAEADGVLVVCVKRMRKVLAG
jgi:hypothetical protein